MIIEGAFSKIPEVLINYENRDELYEANIVNILTNAIILELNARNIDNPLMKIQLEKRYHPSQNIRCDMYSKFDFLDNKILPDYGYYQENWIEAKYYGGINRNAGSETKSENAASILYDLYRLAKYTNGKQNIGLYCLCIFNSQPNSYLAFHRKQGNTEREWLSKLLATGINNISFSLDKEPNTVKKVFDLQNKVEFNAKTRTISFKPISDVGHQFHGYLIQLLSFCIKDDNGEITSY